MTNGFTESDTISYPFPLATNSTIHMRSGTGSSGPDGPCPGTAAAPAAAAGYTCVWASAGTDGVYDTTVSLFDPDSRTILAAAMVANAGSANFYSSGPIGFRHGVGIPLNRSSANSEMVWISWATRAS